MDNYVARQNDENDRFQMSLDTLEKYYEAMNNNDLEGTLSMIHSSSPAQMPTRNMLGQLMHTFKLNYELVESKYIGTDGDYIFFRVNQKTSKLEGPDFKDNAADLIIAMRQDEDVWKIWSVMSLETSFI